MQEEKTEKAYTSLLKCNYSHFFGKKQGESCQKRPNNWARPEELLRALAELFRLGRAQRVLREAALKTADRGCLSSTMGRSQNS
jgi:hypothetical protein